jgi:hypothetical protein
VLAAQALRSGLSLVTRDNRFDDVVGLNLIRLFPNDRTTMTLEILMLCRDETLPKPC